MSDDLVTGAPADAGPGAMPADAPLAPRMGALSRFFNVFFSPGPVFEDIRRNWAGWWVPVVICMLVTTLFILAYTSKYDMPTVMAEQLKESSAMKMVGGLAGPEARDKAIAAAVTEVTGPGWRIGLGFVANILMGIPLLAWFFTFLYGLIAMAMGWLEGARASKLWINFGLVMGVFVCTIVGSIVIKTVRTMGGEHKPGEVPPPTTGAAVAGFLLGAAGG